MMLDGVCLVYVDMGNANSSPVVLTVVTSGVSFARQAQPIDPSFLVGSKFEGK